MKEILSKLSVPDLNKLESEFVFLAKTEMRNSDISRFNDKNEGAAFFAGKSEAFLWLSDTINSIVSEKLK